MAEESQELTKADPSLLISNTVPDVLLEQKFRLKRQICTKNHSLSGQIVEPWFYVEYREVVKNQALAPISIVFLIFLTGCSANDESRTVTSVESACNSLEVGWLYQSTTEKGQMAYAEAASAFRQLSSKNPEFVNFTKGASSAANGDLMYLRELYDALAFCGISTSP